MSINGFGTNENARIDGLEEIYANYIYTDELDVGSTFISQPINYFTGVRSNIQSQIDGIYMDICNNIGRWGSFWDTTTQTNPVANAVNIIKYNNADPSNNGVYLDASLTRLTVLQEGVYNLQFSAQLTNTSATATDIFIWFRKNGTNIAESATMVQVSGSDAETVASWNYVTPMNTSDYLQIAWSSPGTGVSIKYFPVSGNIPVIPSAIATLTEVTGEGPQGPTGATPTISIGTVTSVPNGYSPTVTITGTALNPVLNFELEAGIQGIQGIQGPQGPQGPKGDKGDKGSQAESTIDAIAAASAAAASAVASAAAATASATSATASATSATASVASATASAGSATAAATSATEAAASAASISADIAGLQAQIDVIDENIVTLQEKTANITAIAGVSTTIAGGPLYVDEIVTLDISSPDVLVINSTTSMDITTAGTLEIGTTGQTNITGGTFLNLASDTQTSLIAPIVNINSGVTSGTINIGESLLDAVYIQGLPFSNINWNITSFSQW